MHTPYEITTAQSFCHCFTCYTRVMRQFVHSRVCSPMLYIRCVLFDVFCSLSLVCHSALRHWLSLARFENLHTILPHAVYSPHFLHRLHQLMLNFGVWHLLRVQKFHHEPPIWITTPVDYPYLLGECPLDGTAHFCHVAWRCRLTNMENSITMLISWTSLLWTLHAL